MEICFPYTTRRPQWLPLRVLALFASWSTPRLCLFVVFLFLTLSSLFSSPALSSTVDQPPINALYLLNPPSEYDAFDRLVKTYNGTGAETVIIRPVSSDGILDRKLLAKAVFFAHASAIKLFVLLPTRSMRSLTRGHPEWQDAQYSLQTGNLEPVDRLDLFNPYVMVYLTDFFRDVAGYAVDGIILDEDYYYGDTEGMSDHALRRYKQQYRSPFPARKSLGGVKGNLAREHDVNAYGEAFWNLTELKRARLLVLLQNVIQASRAVNKQIRFGVALHVPGLFPKEKELLAWYSHDVNTFRKSNINFFWLAIPHRDMRDEKEINYKKSIETVARLAMSSLSLVNDPRMLLFGVQSVTNAGKLLPLSEIEEVSMQVRRSGDTGIAFMVSPDAQLPRELTRKIFKKRME